MGKNNITRLYKDPNVEKQLNKANEKYKDNMEAMVTHGLVQPFSSHNSSSRKILANAQWTQRVDLLEPEYPFISTGYENHYGIHSSSYVKSTSNMRILAKISKFSSNPNHHYYLITVDDNNVVDLIERKEFHYNTETYGYLYDTKCIDKYSVGDIIPSGTVIRKSKAFDEFDNHQDGINVLCNYIANPETTEDAIVISESTRRKLSSPGFKKYDITINDNDIPLNLYGGLSGQYKVLPDIGEKILNGILCGIRKENKDESFFTQANNRLSMKMINDITYICEREDAKVVDIDIWSNKTKEERDSRQYEAQLNYYIDDSIRFANEFIDIVTNYIDNSDYVKTPALTKMYLRCKELADNKQIMKDDKIFSNIYMEIIVYYPNLISECDKLTNRHGGKGVISKIEPDENMPRLPDGTPIGLEWNLAGVPNRLNIGQSFETEINNISNNLIKLLDNDYYACSCEIEEWIDCMYHFFSMISVEYANEWMSYLEKNCASDEQIMDFICNSITRYGECMYITVKPLSESLSIDKLSNIYGEYPFIQPIKLLVPIEGSNGKIRYVETNKPSIPGYQYIYRMKQTAEEKHSATALSATNVRNENSKSRGNKLGTSAHSSTPIRNGEMEDNILISMSAEIQAMNLMLYSTSPQGRRSVIQLLTDNPFIMDVKLDEDAKSRSVEKSNAILKTMGVKFHFRKISVELANAFIKDEERPRVFIADEVRPIVFIPDEIRPKVFIPNNERPRVFIPDNARPRVFNYL